MRSKPLLIALALGAVLALSGCTAEPLAPPADAGDLPGFWKGLWHGFIVLFTFVVSLFSDDVAVYAAPNAGHLYDLGFVLGVMVFFGGSGGGSGKKRCC